MEKKIPNLLTFGNLFCGFFGVLSVMNGDLVTAGIMIFVGAFFDLLDGMAARLLKVSSPIGKELDSLCDIVTFGFLPSLIAQALLIKSHADWLNYLFIGDIPVASLITFLILAAAAWRLARFNTGTVSYAYFQGLPTPANAMFFASLPLILQNGVFAIRYDVFNLENVILNPYLIVGLVLLFSWLMISHIPLFTLKLGSLKWKDNKFIFIFVIVCVLLFIFFLWAAIPLIIFLYLILSYFNRPKADEI